MNAPLFFPAMAVEVLQGSIEERVLRYLLDVYPVTVEDLERELKIKRDRLDRVIKSFVQRGIVELDELPDKTYIRLIRSDFHFTSIKASQRRRYKQTGGRKESFKDYEGPMFA